MPTTRDVNGALLLGGVRLIDLAFDSSISTPTYVYDVDAMAQEARELRAAFDGAPHLVAYAVKANTAGAIVRRFAAEGCGADVVSGSELRVALGCGILPEQIVFSGVAKTDDEIDRALLTGDRGIAALQIESIEEIPRVAARARAASRTARVSFRLNPAIDLDALDTHAHIATGHDEAKFGIPRADVAYALEAIAAAPNVKLVGIGAHIGSQFTTVAPYAEGARTVFAIARDVRATHALEFVDAGGGMGVDYGAGCPVRPADFVRAARAEQKAAGLADLALYIEPGRALVATHGVLLAKVIQAKATRSGAPRRWLMIDAGMNDLIRPALYQAVHRVVPLDGAAGETVPYRVVGPVCESSDDFGTHVLPATPPASVALLDAGAYGFTMASVYNGRPVPTEVFLAGGAYTVSARRAADAWVHERLAAG